MHCLCIDAVYYHYHYCYLRMFVALLSAPRHTRQTQSEMKGPLTCSVLYLIEDRTPKSPSIEGRRRVFLRRNQI